MVDGCLLWGERVIVPEKMRQDVLHMLHQGHLRVSRTQALAPLYVWYPGITSDVKSTVMDCAVGQETRNALPLPKSSWPEAKVWGRLHIDFAGPFFDKYICVLVDAATGWVEASICNGPTTDAAIALARRTFSRFGLPEAIVSDYGPAFKAERWITYLKQLGVDAIFTAPYSPFQNGICERRIQWMRSLLLKFKQGTLEVRLINTLAVMRLSPDAEGISPARVLLGWQPEMPIAKICPCAVEVPPAAPAKFEVGDPVYHRVFPVVRYGPKWREGVIFKKEGVNAKTYIVFGSQDHYVRRAACHVRGRGRGGRPPYPRGDYLDTVGQNPVDTTDRPIILSPYACAYGRPRTPEQGGSTGVVASRIAEDSYVNERSQPSIRFSHFNLPLRTALRSSVLS